MGWLADRFRESAGRGDGPLQIMYGIDGRADLEEFELDHLEGYRGSGPVRVGNGAATQLQLDIYGELIDSVYLYNKYGEPISYDDWMALTAIVDWLCDNWDREDEGIWETRGGRQNFTYSRLMCWVAIERAVRIVAPARAARPTWCAGWRCATRSPRQIMERGWHPERRAFVQHYDTDVLDASLLLMPLVKFIAPRDPRWLSTLDAIGEELVVRQPRLPLQRRPPRRTAWTATRARSRSARSGTWRRWPGPATSTRRGSRSRRCSPTPTTSGSTPRRSAPPARRWATSRRRSPTSR